MALNSNNLPRKNSDSKKYAPVDPGTYPARVVQIIDLGLQPQRAYAGKEKAPANEVMITYELLDEFLTDDDGEPLTDKPRWQSETLPWYGLFADKAKSTQRYLVLDPKQEHEGDLAPLVGSPCNVTLIHNPNAKDPENPYVNIANISAMRPRDAANAPELINPSKVFDLSNPDLEVFNSLPKWIQEKITGNLEYAGSPLEGLLKGGKGVAKAKPEKAVKQAVKAAPEPDAEDEDVPY